MYAIIDKIEKNVIHNAIPLGKKSLTINITDVIFLPKSPIHVLLILMHQYMSRILML